MPYVGRRIEFKTRDGRVAGVVGPTYLYRHEAAAGIASRWPESEWVIGLAVMREESLLSPDAEGDLLRVDEPTGDGRHWGPSVQVLQIRTIEEARGTGGPRDIERLKASTEDALDEAFALWKERESRKTGTGWTHWGAFTSGRYKQHVAWAKEVFAERERKGTVQMATAKDVLAEASRELGYTESPRGSNRNKFAAEAGHANGQPWCATFIVAIARRCDIDLPSESAYTPTMAEGFRKIGRFSKAPSVGAIAFFDFPDSKRRIQHVGIVERWGSGHWGPWVQTIDGNTGTQSEDNGGAVQRRVRSMSYVVAFGHPEYAEEDELMAIFKDREDAKAAIREVLDENPVDPKKWGLRWLLEQTWKATWRRKADGSGYQEDLTRVGNMLIEVGAELGITFNDEGHRTTP